MSAFHTRLSATLDSRQDRAILRKLTNSNFDLVPSPGPNPSNVSHSSSGAHPSASAIFALDSSVARAASVASGPADAPGAASVKGKGRMVDFSSNDYLSLSTKPAIKRRFVKAFMEPSEGGEGLSPYGPPSSRLLDGNSREHQALERQLVGFLKANTQACCQTLEEAADGHARSPQLSPVAGLLFNSGFDANLSVFATLPAPDDYILFDELVHASTHDGMRASRVPKERRTAFRHSDVADLTAKIGQIRAADGEVAGGRRNVWVAVESLYSMDGDVCPLREVVEAVEGLLPGGNGLMVVDEAHSTGLYGKEGRGLVALLGLEERVAVRVATFGKAVACSGGKQTGGGAVCHRVSRG